MALALWDDLLALWTGLTLANERGWTNITVESDSKTSVETVRRALKGLVLDCRRLLGELLGGSINRIYRGVNRCTDSLANLAVNFPLGSHVLDTPSHELDTSMESVARDVTISRHIT